jgi:aryl-alcohol dehydrogenase-like predicted oxidoreductase
MKLRNLGNSDLKVSLVGLGCNNFGGRIDLEASRNVIDKAIEVGITLFDTADIYGNSGGSEEILGKVLGARRKDIVLATKFGMQMGADESRKGASRRYIMAAVEDSLKRLQTDWIDLYQLHTPDALTPMEETLHALDDLVKQGKVRAIGCSNVPADDVVASLQISKTQSLSAFVSCQDEYSLVVRDPEKELIPAMEQHGLGLLPYFPLASGLLTGKYKAGAMPEGTRIAGSERLRDRVMTDENIRIAAALEEFATARGHSMLELAIGWLASHPVISSVIAGATKPEQVEANAKAVCWELSADEMAEVDRISAKS